MSEKILQLNKEVIKRQLKVLLIDYLIHINII